MAASSRFPIDVQGIGIVADRGADPTGESGRIRGCIDAGRGSDASQDRGRIGTERIVADERDVAPEVGEDVRVGPRTSTGARNSRPVGGSTSPTAQPVAGVDRAEVRAEFEMADVRHVPPDKRLGGVQLQEIEVLAQHRGGVVERIAERDEDDRIGKQPDDLGNAGQIGVVFSRDTEAHPGFCALRRAITFLMWGSDERLELPMNVLVVRRPHGDAILEILVLPERAPHDFLERLGAVEADGHAIAMGALDGDVGNAKGERDGVPEEGNEHKTACFR